MTLKRILELEVFCMKNTNAATDLEIPSSSKPLFFNNACLCAPLFERQNDKRILKEKKKLANFLLPG